jgi:predicted NUDIX family NTP pyrophosphohydrolase
MVTLESALRVPMTGKKSDKQAKKVSAGLLMYRTVAGPLEVLLVHLGGPFWSRKDAGAWFVPKGGVEEGEDEFAAAQREFLEETGMPSHGPFLELGNIYHKSGKRVIAWAFRGDGDPAALHSNLFRMEWPPRSGKFQEFPEIDRADFFTLEAAAEKMHPAEFEFVQRLDEMVFAREGKRKKE